MIFIQHRVNTLDDLKKVNCKNGIEVDVRYHKNKLVLHHDPFNHHLHKPIELKTLLQHWKNDGPIILNIKTEGIEQMCIDTMQNFKITNWFFLDISMPYMVKYSLEASKGSIEGFGPENLAVRFSEFEPIEYALSFQGRAEWIWVDCFNIFPVTSKIYSKIKSANFKLCLVSPELQNHELIQIEEFRSQIKNIRVDAICTKRPDLWIS